MAAPASFSWLRPLAGAGRGAVLAGLAVLALAPVQAGDILRVSPGSSIHGTAGSASSGSAAAPSSQAATAATAATSQQAQTAALSARAQSSLMKATAALHAQQSAQAAARALAAGAGSAVVVSGTPPTVPNGLSIGGLNPIFGLQTSGTASQPGISNPVPSGSTSWVNASAPVQSFPDAGGKTTVTVTQTAQQALLSWQTFNIGSGTKLVFDQSLGGANVGNWIALNKVAVGIAPSQILGSISALGQVYVINQNGIIFGGASEINTGALVAASLPINSNLAGGEGIPGRGLLNNPDLQFLFSQLDIPAGTQGPTASFQPQENAPAPTSGLVAQVDRTGNVSLVPATGQDGDVVIQAGAQLSSPTTPQHVGGKIALIGPNVSNAGAITSPDGQVILAAGLQVGFAASTDPSLRGLDVTVGQVSDPSYAGTSGVASNSGDIEAPRADVTVTGSEVNQLGVINSSTSVALNGRVDLLADYDATVFINSVDGFNGTTGLYPLQTGAITFGANSLTQIQPELSNTDTAVGTKLALASQMNFQGKTIYLGPSAAILAPSGNLSFNAGTFLPSVTGYDFYHTTGQVYLDTGATVDVSGAEDVSASVAQDIIPVQLLGTELANSPLQRDGPLRGKTVYVDIRQVGTYDGMNWIGTPIGDVSGYVNLIGHTVGQLSTSGGSVTIDAGNSVVLQPGAAVNVSGGWTDYQGATVQTTKVLSGGLIYDISQATPDRVYSGIYSGFTDSSAKYGTSQNFTSLLQTSPQYLPGYLQGGQGGSLSISAPALAMDGTLTGNTVAGTQQLTPIAQLAKTYAGATFLPATLAISGVPNAGSLSLNFVAQDANNPAGNYPTYAPTPPTVFFQNGSSGQAPAQPFALDPATGDPAALNASRVSTVVLSPDLVNKDGFGSLSIVNSDGAIVVPAGVSLAAPLAGSVSATGAAVAGGSINLSAANLTIDGSIIAPGGNLSFSVYDFSPYAVLPEGAATPAPDATRGNFTLGSAATLSTAGLLIAPAQNGLLPTIINGGSIAIRGYNTDLATGSTIDASGGIQVSVAGKQTYGTGGSITLAGGQDLNFAALLGGQLQLGGNLEAFSGSTGGTLSLTAPLFQVGGNSLQNGDTTGTGDTLWLAPEFFSTGGFGTFNLTGLGKAVVDGAGNSVVDSAGNAEFDPAILIAPGTVLAPVAQSWQSTFNGSGLSLVATTQPLPSERTPVSLNFTAPGVVDQQNSGLLVTRGDFILGLGAAITTDPQSHGGGVSVKAQTAAILGSIIAPGGTIGITGGNSFANVANNPLLEPTVDLGPKSYLSTKGAVELAPNALGYTTGTVLAGGQINISGNIVAEAGSVLDVSGTSATLDVLPNQAGRMATGILTRLVPLREDSNGGSITLSGGQELFSDATLLGAAGGPTAQGGSLNISSGLFLPTTTSVESPLDATLIVTQNGPTLPVPDYYAGQPTAIGHAVIDAQGNPIAGRGYFAVDSFDNSASGFDALTLGGTVQFEGPVTIEAKRSLTIASNPRLASGGIIYADAAVVLNAPYISLGQSFLGPQPAAAPVPPFVGSDQGQVFVPPVYGAGSLTAHASELIDVGNLSLQNIGQVNLTAAGGDIRGDGTLEVAGDLSLVAGQIYPATETTFTLAARDHDGVDGTITIGGSGLRQLPLSAGGTLNIFAADILQGGTLRAPIGTINLGSGVTSASPLDAVTGSVFDSTRQLTLAAGSITSVSAIDPITGQALQLPYGVNVNGVEFEDPAGNNITAAGNGPNAIPAKSITISAANVADEAGSSIDISGGGDLFAYQFVSGTGGTHDVLASSASFAIVPGYQAKYAPDYSTSDYHNSNLALGEQVYLSASAGLPAGVYTLLPARYALLPGAFLITPKGGATSTPASSQPNGSSIVSGYIFTGTNPGAGGQPLLSSFEVDSPARVQALAQYDISSGTTFLAESSAAQGSARPRLPIDAGQLVLAAEATLAIDGNVVSHVPAGGQGSLVDIASPSNILIAGSEADLGEVPATTLVLDAAGLSAFGADSLLIGGYRGKTGTTGTPVTVTTSSLTVDNAGAGNVLTAPDIILVSRDDLTLDPGAQIEQGTRALSGSAQTLVFGDAGVAASGDGALVRVTSDAAARIVRLGVDPAAPASLVVGAGAVLSGTNLTLDSTQQSTLLSTSLSGSSVNLDSGLISLVLDDAPRSGVPQGLVLSSAALQSLQASATALSLLSYSAIDVYGSGSIGGNPAATGAFPVDSFALHAAAIRGDGGAVAINAGTISIDNSPGAVESASPPDAIAGGTLTLNAATVKLGTDGQTAVNGVTLGGYDQVAINAANGILLQGAGSTTDANGAVTRGAFSLTATGHAAGTGDLTLSAGIITGATAANGTITAGGALTILSAPNAAGTLLAGGLGAQLGLVGQSITDNGSIRLDSGNLNLEATQGNLVMGNQGAASIDLSGTTKVFNDLTAFTPGGNATFVSDTGSVLLGPGARVDVAAQPAGGNAGSLSVRASEGDFSFGAGTMVASSGAGGKGGSFELDVGTVGASDLLGGNDLTPLETALNEGGFTQSQSIRVRGGLVGGTVYRNVYLSGTNPSTEARARVYDLSADTGSIFVNGGIDASGVTGGTIQLASSGSVVLGAAAHLSVAAQKFDDAGKGGAITLAAGAETSGHAPASTTAADPTTGRFADKTAVVDIQNGATLDLSVLAAPATGDASGTLHLRAPQISDGSDLQVDPIQGSILGASRVVVEGYKTYTPAGGLIDAVEGGPSASAAGDGTVFGDALQFTLNTNTILKRLLGETPTSAQAAVFQITPGAEIVNPTGDLTLSATWDLSGFRFGPGADPAVPGTGVAGVLNLRAAGNLIFADSTSPASLSDGFSGYNGTNTSLWQATLMSGQSWSYQLTAGADFDAADSAQVATLADLNASGLGGSIEIGLGSPALPTSTTGATGTIIPNYFQVIRTGTGDITVNAGRDVQLLDPLATIYTAGTQAAPLADFAAPNLTYKSTGLGSNPLPVYPATYSQSGGNVSISAQGNIGHYLADGSGGLNDDSTRELPTSWLFRQGFLQNGEFAASHSGGPIEGTSWWVQFNNFFEGVGALGGGNVSLVAGSDISNVDAVVPTNARMPGLVPDAANLVELGGGDLQVQAGRDISGGVYYVERGQGALSAGDSIHSNFTRATLSQVGSSILSGSPADATTWLPTTLYLGQGGFDVSATGSVLMGPVVNPFLLPQSIYNSFYNKTYFSTYAGGDSVEASSLTGAVMLKDNVVNVSGTYYEGAGSLSAWYSNVLLKAAGTYAQSQPWLALVETNVTPFDPALALLPPTLRATAFSGDIDIVGGLVLAPSAVGTIDLAASGAINGFQPNAVNDSGSVASAYNPIDWGSSLINLSDADPSSLPGVASPLSFASPATGFQGATFAGTLPSLFANFASLFNETGATDSVLQTREALHTPGLLHAQDADPIRLYAQTGGISGFTLFSGKFARIITGQDLTDVALYIQNDSAQNTTFIGAARDVIAYDPNSALRQASQTPGNEIFDQNSSFPEGQFIGAPTAGDIQISGPGALEVLAGRNLNLGVGPSHSDGTAVGITSVGKQRDPYLPFDGADVTAGAGIGGAPDYGNFISAFLAPGTTYAGRYLPELASLLDVSSTDEDVIYAAFRGLAPNQQSKFALDIFYDVLRDAGRDHNNPGASGSGNYEAANAAIAALFPSGTGGGDISLTSREIKTESGGDISLLAPHGQLTVGFDITGNQPVDQGILTVDGGNISIFTQGNVNVGTSRIFTLSGGNEIIYSATGDIAAGASSKTVQSAPPTRVIVDPQSGNVQTDLAGLATGGGIGVLETVVGAAPSDVDLIAPRGTVDAGDAGIRASGNLNIAAVQVLNAGNIQVGGKSAGIPTAVAPNLAGLAAASGAAGAASNAASQVGSEQRNRSNPSGVELPSIITVEVLGYGGGE